VPTHIEDKSFRLAGGHTGFRAGFCGVICRPRSGYSAAPTPVAPEVATSSVTTRLLSIVCG
jgi:hypothetical protein